MKTLYLLRHADAERRHDIEDINRPITSLGISQLVELTKKASDKNIKLDSVLCSPAKRTLQTCQLFLEGGLFENQITIDNLLYNPLLDNIIASLRNIDNKNNQILLVSHNPTISEFTNFLVGLFEPQVSFGTANLAKLELDIASWQEISEGCAKTIWFI